MIVSLALGNNSKKKNVDVTRVLSIHSFINIPITLLSPVHGLNPPPKPLHESLIKNLGNNIYSKWYFPVMGGSSPLSIAMALLDAGRGE